MENRANRIRLALFGPVFPYRGGIAQYTTFLKRALEKVCDLKTISFSRQYPKFLYPGKSDLDPFWTEGKEANADFLLDALNPFTWKNAVDSVKSAGCEFAVINYWTIFWGPGFAFMSILLRRLGIKTLFLCHNLFDHDSKGIKKTLSFYFLSKADGYIVHSKAQEKFLRNKFPDKPILFVLHPIYVQFPEPKGKLKKRGRLEILFFGFIRPYKGLDLLLRALANLNDSKIFLTVVGEPWGGDEEKFISLTESLNLKNVEFHFSYVSENEVSEFFSRADILALPYYSATGSGAATIAYRYEKPVLVSKVGGFIDFVEEGKTGFFFETGSIDDLSAKIKNLSREKISKMGKNIRNFKRLLTWDHLSLKLLEFIKSFQVPSSNV